MTNSQFPTHRYKHPIRVVNVTRGTTVVNNGEAARSIWSRFMGLMGRTDLPEGYGLLLQPCNSVHMFFMSISLDVLHVAADGHIIKILHALKPWRMGPMIWKSAYVLELPAGTARQTGTVEGDYLDVLTGTSGT